MQCRTCGEHGKEGLSSLDPEQASLLQFIHLQLADRSFFVCHDCVVEIQHWRHFLTRFQTSQTLFQQVLKFKQQPDSPQQTDVEASLESILPKCRVLVAKLLQCDSCSFYTNSKSQLETHMHDHLPRTTSEETKTRKRPVIEGRIFRNLKCAKCELYYTHREMLTWHSEFCHGRGAIVKVVKISNRKRNYQCILCQTVCKTHHLVLGHLRTQHNFVNFPLPCTGCGHRFISIEWLMRHKCSMHDMNGASSSVSTHGVKCKLCTEVFESDVQMKEHVSTAHTTKFKTRHFNCLHCNESFVNISQLKSHCRNAHAEKHIFQCNVCKLNFSSHTTYLQHTRNEHDDMFTCNTCAATFSVHSNLLNHIKTVHTHISSFSCKFCGVKLSSEKILKRHMHDIHMGSILHCAHCTYTTRRKDCLDLHLKSKHIPMKKSLACKICSAKFRFKPNLQRHIHNMHTGPILHCKHCDYSTSIRVTLNRHIEVVHSHNMLACKFCDAKFKCKSYLHDHVRHCHTGRLLQCKNCDFSTRRRQNLKIHIRCKHS